MKKVDQNYLKTIFSVGVDKTETGPKSNKLTKEELDSEYANFFMFFSAFFLFGGYLGYSRHVLSRVIDDRVAMTIRRKIYSELLQKEYTLFTSKMLNPSTITQKIVTNTSSVCSNMADSLVGLFRGMTFLVGGTGLLVYHLPDFTFMSLSLVATLSLSSKWFNSRIHDASKAQTESLTKVSEYIGDQMTNIQTIKLLNTNKRSSAQLDDLLKNNHFKNIRVATLWGLNIAILEIFGIGGLIGILTYGSYLISIGVMPSDKIMMV